MTPPNTSPARGRPRSQDTDRRLLDAARDMLAEGGYDALTFDALSRATGIPRSMIYRRWPTRTHLANMIASGGDVTWPNLLDTKGLQAQISALVHEVLDRYRRPDIGAAAIGVIAATQGNRDLQRELQTEAETAARRALGTIIRQGQETGLICSSIQADIVFDMIVGTLVYRALFSLEDVPSGYAEQVTRQIILGLAPA